MANTGFNPTVLKTVPLFSLLADHELAALLPSIQHRSYARNAFMVCAGEKADALYVVLAGRAKVLIDDGEGREVILAVIGAKEFFGEMGLVDERPRCATVQAMERCEVLYVPKRAFMRCFKGNPGISTLILRTVIARLRGADRTIEGLALMGVYGRVARVLMDAGREVNGQWMVEPGSEQIAKMVAASREMVSRVLKDLKEKGLIDRYKRKIKVLDRASVAKLACARA